jgi:hypothetical protein
MKRIPSLSSPFHAKSSSACSFRWFIVDESTVRWFIMREKYCWMAADLAEPAKRTGRISADVAP